MSVFTFVKAGKQFFNTIKGVGPNVGKPSKSALAKQIQKTKASGAKLKQTLFESKNKAFKGDDFTFGTSNKKTLSNTEKQKLKEGLYGGGSKVTKKATGGRVGRRFGSPNPRKTSVQKIKETFGPKKKVPNKFKGFSKLPEKVQQKIDVKLAKKV